MYSLTRKMPQRRTLKISLCHLLVNFKNVRVLEPPMLIGSELWRQSLSLIFPPIQASNGAMPSTKQERRIVVIIRVRGCKMMKKIRNESFTGCEHYKACLWEFYWYWGECKLTIRRFRSGGMPFSVKRVSQATILVEIALLWIFLFFFQ